MSKIILSDCPIDVCMEFVQDIDKPLHAYGIRASLAAQGREYSDRGISNSIQRLMELEIIEKDPVLQSNPLGPARQYFRLMNYDLAKQIILDTLTAKEQAVIDLRERTDELFNQRDQRGVELAKPTAEEAWEEYLQGNSHSFDELKVALLGNEA